MLIEIGDFWIFASYFFILTSVASKTSWGQTIRLTNLNEVSNFSWGCQLSYETLFVGSVSKLKPPETTISHRVILEFKEVLGNKIAIATYFWTLCWEMIWTIGLFWTILKINPKSTLLCLPILYFWSVKSTENLL